MEDKKNLKRLISNKRVVSEGQLVRDPNSKIVSYRLLDKPLNDLMNEDLKKNPWSAIELSKRYGIATQGINEELRYIKEDACLHRAGYYLRIVDKKFNPCDGHIYSYQLVSIPFESRILDPLLGFSLLGWQQYTKPHNNTIQWEKDYQKYTKKLSLYWGLSTELFKLLREKPNISFANTIMGPIPVIEDPSILELVRNRLGPNARIQDHFKYSEGNIIRMLYESHDMMSKIPTICSMGALYQIQKYSLSLSDLIDYCDFKDKRRELELARKINSIFFKTIFKV
jgi:hypothetical protein